MTPAPVAGALRQEGLRQGGLRQGWDPSQLVAVLVALFLVALIGLPVGWLAFFAISDRGGALTSGNFETLFSDPDLLDPLLTSLSLSVSVAVLAVLAAAPLAWIVSRTDLPARRVIRALMTASFVTPPFLGAIAWEVLAAPNSGIINKLWRDLTGSSDPLFDIYSFGGLLFVISCYTAPYVFVLLTNALDRIPADLEDAAGILGAGVWKIARSVTIPLVAPALLAGALIAFLQAMTLFGSPAILALPAGFHTITTKIYSLFQFPPKPQLAAAAALPLLLLTIGLLWAQRRILGRRGYSVVGGKSGEARLTPLGRWRWPVLILVLLVLSLPLFLPYGALIKAAISRVSSGPLTADNLTMANFNFVFFEFSQTRTAFVNTFLLALATATVGSLLALAGIEGAGVSGDSACGDPRHRAGGGPVPRLHARAVCAVWHALDPVPGVSHHRVAGGVSAIARLLPCGASGAGGGLAHPGGKPAFHLEADHSPPAEIRPDFRLVSDLYRRGAGTFGGGDAVERQHQSAVGRDLRSERERELGGHRRVGRGHADHDLRRGRDRELGGGRWSGAALEGWVRPFHICFLTAAKIAARPSRG